MTPRIKAVVFAILGPIVIGLLYFSLMSRAVTHATQGISDGMQRQSAQVTARAREQAADSARSAEETKRALLEGKVEQARAETQAAQAEREAAARKDAAWNTFFKPSKACNNPPDWDAQVECGNAHIRAKKDFEDRWARGQFE